jgi:hypothetical protein
MASGMSRASIGMALRLIKICRIFTMTIINLIGICMLCIGVSFRGQCTKIQGLDVLVLTYGIYSVILFLYMMVRIWKNPLTEKISPNFKLWWFISDVVMFCLSLVLILSLEVVLIVNSGVLRDKGPPACDPTVVSLIMDCVTIILIMTGLDLFSCALYFALVLKQNE